MGRKKKLNHRLWNLTTNDIPLHGGLPKRPLGFIESAAQDSGKSYLTLLWENLQLAETETLSFQQTVITGMGGLGKTNLALAYAWEAVDYKAYNVIAWLQSETDTSLMQGYRNLLQDIAPGISINDADDERIIRLIKQYVAKQGKCLLVYDNVPSPDFLTNKIPQHLGTDVIITSRCNEGWESSCIDLDVFRPEDSVEYLLSMTGLEPSVENKSSAEALAKELTHLPLALSHAVGYIKYISGSSVSNDNFEKYLEEFRKEPTVHFDEHHNPFSKHQPKINYEHLIAKTWSMSGKIISDILKRIEE